MLDQARAIPMPSDRQIIHVLPQEYIVDDQDCIREPVGMCGVRLQAHVHLVTAASTSVQNILKCAERCGLHVAETVLEPLASAAAVLFEDEKELGVALVDIGGGTTDIVVYVNGAVVHTAVIPIGGTNFTQDVATALRTPLAEAERVKIKYGCASPAMIDPEATIEVPSVGGRPPRIMPRVDLCAIIEPRVEELFQLVGHTIDQGNYRDFLGAGVVITGGTTQLDGMPELAEQILGLPVRRGAPTGVGGLLDVVRSPAYATGVGLVKYGAAKLRNAPRREAMAEQVVAQANGSTWGTRLGQWFKEVF